MQPAARSLLLALVVCLQWPASGQDTAFSLKASVDRNHMLLGEQVRLSLRYTYPAQIKPEALPAIPDSLGHFEVTDSLKADTVTNGGWVSITRTYVLTSFDSGHWVIPVLSFSAGNKTAFSDTVGVEVATFALSGNDYNDIRDIFETPGSNKPWLWWLAGLLALAAFGAWLLVYRRRKKGDAPAETPGLLPPYDQAMKDLEILEGEKMFQKGQVKDYYSRLNAILRVYLDRKFNMRVMQQTSDDMLLKLKAAGLDREDLGRLTSVLRISDAVKFARYGSSEDESGESLRTTGQIIKTIHSQKA